MQHCNRRIKVPRPNKEGAREIFEIYLQDKPLQGTLATSKKFAKDFSERIYSPENIVYEVVMPEKGVIGRFDYSHLISGAMIRGIVDRGTGYAIKREIAGGKKGLSLEDLERSTNEEFSENTGFAQTLVRDDWETVFGSKGRQYQEAHKHGYLLLQRYDQSERRDSKK